MWHEVYNEKSQRQP